MRRRFGQGEARAVAEQGFPGGGANHGGKAKVEARGDDVGSMAAVCPDGARRPRASSSSSFLSPGLHMAATGVGSSAAEDVTLQVSTMIEHRIICAFVCLSLFAS